MECIYICSDISNVEYKICLLYSEINHINYK